MQGRSASDRARSGDRAATGPADRLSLTVSVMLIGGLLLASMALYQNAQIDKPKPPKRPPAPVVRQIPTKPGHPATRFRRHGDPVAATARTVRRIGETNRRAAPADAAETGSGARWNP